MIETRGVFKSGVSAVIYTNTNRLIKGNTVRDKFLVMADSVLFIDSDVNVPGGYLGIHEMDNNVDISFIKSTDASGKFLKDDGSWATVDCLPAQSGNDGKFLVTNGSVASWNTLTSNVIGGTFLFTSGYGIDTRATADTDVLNIGTTNANVINYGNSSTVHNFLGTAIYELQVNSYIKDKVITLNSGGAVGSGVGVGFEVEENSAITGFFKTNASRNGFSLKAPSVEYLVEMNHNLLTADRAYSFPNVAGTFLVGSVADGSIAYGSSGVLTGSSNLAWNGSLLKVNGSAYIGGTADPSALLHLAAGTNSKAALKLSNGSLLTTAESGAFEFVTTRLYFTGTDAVRKTIAYLTDIGSASPGGSDTSIQYNSSGSFAGSERFVFTSSNYLKLEGSALFGLAVSNEPTAFVDVAPATTGRASLRIRPSAGTTPSSPNEGDIWNAGSFLWIRIGGVNKKFTLA